LRALDSAHNLAVDRWLVVDLFALVIAAIGGCVDVFGAE
jgi:hypothetical protein